MSISPKSLNILHLTKGHKVDRLQFEALGYAMRLAKAIGQDISGLRVTSGYRDLASQARLYKLYLAGKGNIAAKPGASWHHYTVQSLTECRGAIDFSHPTMSQADLQKAMVTAMAKHEFKFHTCLKERSCVHVQFLYGGGSKNKGLVK